MSKHISGGRGGGSRRTNTTPTGPSDEAKKAVMTIIGAIENCDPSDRGYVLNRISQVYFQATGAKAIKTALKSAKASKKKPKVSWKKQWADTSEYKAWQAHIAAHKGETPEQQAPHAESYKALRQEAFRVRDALKGTGVNTDGGQDQEGTEDTSE